MNKLYLIFNDTSICLTGTRKAVSKSPAWVCPSICVSNLPSGRIQFCTTYPPSPCKNPLLSPLIRVFPSTQLSLLLQRPLPQLLIPLSLANQQAPRVYRLVIRPPLQLHLTHHVQFRLALAMTTPVCRNWHPTLMCTVIFRRKCRIWLKWCIRKLYFGLLPLSSWTAFTTTKNREILDYISSIFKLQVLPTLFKL